MPVILLSHLLAAASAAVAPFNLFANVSTKCATTISLPEPSGPNNVGTSVFHFIDTKRMEAGSVDPNDYRQVEFQLWYPAIRDRDSKPVAYNPELQIMRAFFAS